MLKVTLLVLLFSSFSSADFQSLDNVASLVNEGDRSWKRSEDQQLTYDNENYVDPYRQKPSPNYNRNSIENDYTSSDYDENKSLAAKRAWKFLYKDRSRGYGKREQQQGNWNNLRGLWGKRSAPSSWGRLQGSWG
jgi:hypothetical protein